MNASRRTIVIQCRSRAGIAEQESKHELNVRFDDQAQKTGA